MTLSVGARQLPAHLVAGGLALSLAGFVANTAYMTTAVQFVSPLAVILGVHLGWLAATAGLRPGFARVAIARTLATAFCIAAVTTISAIIAPMPAEANPEDGFFSDAIVISVCLAIVTVVLLAGAAIVAGLIWLVSKFFPNRDNNRKFDVGAVAVALLAIGAASQEGVSPRLTFDTHGRASSTIVTQAPPERVWQAVSKATSPEFPLPAILRAIPRPVAIVVDEGSALGARRVVRFAGREGAGDLELRVSQRTQAEAVFKVDADGSPIANWVKQNSLTFRVEPAATGTRLTVSLDYDRRLSPAWFFAPYIRLAAFLAADVLARDTAERAGSY